jgi:hypothetical protein
VNELKLSRGETIVLQLLVTLGASSFDAPGGPAYMLMRRLEEQHKILVTTDDIINLLNKIKDLKK